MDLKRKWLLDSVHLELNDAISAFSNRGLSVHGRHLLGAGALNRALRLMPGLEQLARDTGLYLSAAPFGLGRPAALIEFEALVRGGLLSVESPKGRQPPARAFDDAVKSTREAQRQLARLRLADDEGHADTQQTA